MLKINVNANELNALGRCLNILFKKVSGEMDYTDFYNFKTLMQKVFSKIYTLTYNNNKCKFIKVNLNEFNTLRLFFNLYPGIFSGDSLVYENTIFLRILGDCDRQIKSLGLPVKTLDIII